MSTDETLNIFNNYIGDTEFSETFNKLLSDNHLNESDGYLIKFKVYNEIMKNRVNEDNVINRVNSIANRLSDRRSYKTHVFDYDYEIIRYLSNSEDNKIFCENCGNKLLYIDKYCYNCGKKQNPQITLIELLSSINSEYIKPGDIIKINEDYSIDKTSYEYNKQIDESKINENIESIYNHDFNKREIEHKYLRIVLLDYINRMGNPSSFIDKYPYHNFEELILTIHELENENLISKSIKNVMKDYVLLFENKSRDSFNETLHNNYNLSEYAIYLLSNHSHVLFYYNVIKNSVIDDIVEYDRLCQTKDTNQSFKEVILNLIRILRDKYFLKGFYTEYHSSFDMEAYVHELFGDSVYRMVILLKKFIIKSSFNIQRGINPLEINYMTYLGDNIYASRLNLDDIKYLFNQAYVNVNKEEALFEEDELLNVLLSYLNGEDIEKLNFDLIKIYSQKQ
ncbi:MAG: hypothetical protein Q4Q22_05665 [Methanosphaera sp.]|nr:hypothetical protein [Methanosphaera sp.]